MLYYPNNYKLEPLNNDRFVLPFLGGALIGGAAVGLTRPRPIYNVVFFCFVESVYRVFILIILYK